MRNVDLPTVILLLGITMARTLSIEPNHDKPCIVGDAWAEDCRSCVCLGTRVAYCRPTFCASKLTRALDTCKEGEKTKVGCNTCICRKNKRICSKKHCPKIST
ncbi:uncharacterized protein [Venturia canescens]|uniref:uncharacterized protein n=1 Tax=Venturia canescens TaxID=32260 RepID=UPI001C9D595E|nr:uncharacterized protein LOC122405763 [Venturia canescens]